MMTKGEQAEGINQTREGSAQVRVERKQERTYMKLRSVPCQAVALTLLSLDLLMLSDELCVLLMTLRVRAKFGLLF